MPPDPGDEPLPTLEILSACRRCDLWQEGTKGVPGSGAPRPAIVLVGEQPGDEEDRQGVPFIGPAGRLLQRAVDEAGPDRAAI